MTNIFNRSACPLAITVCLLIASVPEIIKIEPLQRFLQTIVLQSVGKNLHIALNQGITLFSGKRQTVAEMLKINHLFAMLL
jgi:hypothetical protein